MYLCHPNVTLISITQKHPEYSKWTSDRQIKVFGYLTWTSDLSLNEITSWLSYMTMSLFQL